MLNIQSYKQTGEGETPPIKTPKPMAHNLNMNNGIASLVTAKDTPWHKLGTILPDRFTAKEALRYGGLDFEVKKLPALVRIGDRRIPIPGKFATVRMDTETPLGAVGNYYKPLQNENAFDFFDYIVDRGEAIYESAGVLGAGEIVFLCAKLPESIKVPGDVMDMYILLFNAHDGSMPLTGMFTPVKTVCQNTLNAGIRQGKMKITLRHTKNIKAKMEEAVKIMGIAGLYTNGLTEAFNHMNTIKADDPTAYERINMVFLTNDELRKVALGDDKAVSTRKMNIIQEVMHYYLNDSTLDGIRGTNWGVYNAVTGFFQNVKEYRTDNTKMQSLVMGGADWRTQQRAFDLLTR